MAKKKKENQPPLEAREQYYIKRGRKYFKVNDPVACDGLGQGAWLVIVNKSCTSIRTQVDPKMTELDAALEYLEDGMCKAMCRAGEMRHRNTLYTEKEKKAWAAYKKTMGKDMPNLFEYASYQEIASKTCKYIKEIMLENNMNIDKIKEKYEIKKQYYPNAIFSLQIDDEKK